ncbi:MAG: hypothetical protein LBV17_11545, partial [Treponema sp.]|nr:hypothetical protein [Treponema sp.]
TLLPGDYEINFDWKAYKEPDTESEKIDLESVSEQYTVQKLNISDNILVSCHADKKYLLIINRNPKSVSR